MFYHFNSPELEDFLLLGGWTPTWCTCGICEPIHRYLLKPSCQPLARWYLSLSDSKLDLSSSASKKNIRTAPRFQLFKPNVYSCVGDNLFDLRKKKWNSKHHDLAWESPANRKSWTVYTCMIIVHYITLRCIMLRYITLRWIMLGHIT